MEGGAHSEAVMIEDWMRELKGHNVTICGAFNGECIDDLETALRFLGVGFRKEKSLTV